MICKKLETDNLSQVSASYTTLWVRNAFIRDIFCATYCYKVPRPLELVDGSFCTQDAEIISDFNIYLLQNISIFFWAQEALLSTSILLSDYCLAKCFWRRLALALLLHGEQFYSTIATFIWNFWAAGVLLAW